MGLLDFLFGKKPSDSLPPWLKNIYNNPAPEYLNYLQTGYMPPMTSTSGSSTTSTGYSATNAKGTSQFRNQPFITSDYAPVATLQRNIIYDRLQNGGLPEAYKAEGLRNIRQTGAMAAKSLEGYLTSRGLSGLTASGQDALAGTVANTQASFLNNLPLLARDNQTQDLGLAQSIIGQFGTGQMGQGATTSQSVTNTRNQSDTSGFSSSPGGFDYQGYGGLMSSLMPYYSSGRQGGLIPSLLPIFATWLGNRGSSKG